MDMLGGIITACMLWNGYYWEEKKLQEKNGNKGLRIQHAQSDNGEKKVPYRDKKNK